MDHTALRSQLPALVAGQLPRNSRTFKFRIYDDKPTTSSLGFYIDPKPFQGKVIATTDDAIVIKVARTEFAVLDRSLATEAPDEGAMVEVTPYARRRFDGRRVDTPEEGTRCMADGHAYATRTIVLGGSPVKLPVPAPRCPALAMLVEQFEKLPAPDGFRRITHLLVDAGACDFETVDPTPGNSVRMPPAICFTVNSAKFQGRVTVLYDRGLDLYAIELRRDNELVDRTDDVSFDDLGDALEHLIDDGRWRRIHVHVLPGKTPRVRH